MTAMHHLIIGPRRSVTACGIRVVAYYPNSKTALPDKDDGHINCSTAPDFDGTKITCIACNGKVPQP